MTEKIADYVAPLYSWDFAKNDVFTYGGTEYVVEKTTRASAYVTSMKNFKSYRIPFVDLNRAGLKKADIKPATETQLKALEAVKPAADPRIRLGAVVTMTSPDALRKFKFTKTDRFVVFKASDGIMNLVQLGGNDTGQYWRMPATGLAFCEV